MIARLACFAAVMVIVLPRVAFAAEPPGLHETAQKLYASLNEEQRREATLPVDSPELRKEVFTGGERPGIQIKRLSAEQQALAVELLAAFTSADGKRQAEQVMAQETQDPGIGHYYLCFFGEPGAGRTYAWRIAEHHLTLVQLEVEKGEPKSFGPILLGADPPVLWADEEEKLIALYAALTPAEREDVRRTGRGVSTARLEGGVRVGDLGAPAQEAARTVLEGRLAFFSAPIRERAERIIDAHGGLEAMRIAFWGEATKKCRDGGRWDFKLGGESFLCDYENSRGHIHLSMKGELAEAPPK